MNSETSQSQVVLVPVDFSDLTARVVESAGYFAKALGRPIFLMHVAEPQLPPVAFETGPLPVMNPTIIQPEVPGFDDGEEKLGRLRDHLEALGVQVEAESFPGQVAEEIVAQAKKRNAAMIVMGSHGHGAVYHLFVGSVATGVLKAAVCPVLIVPRLQE